MQLKVRLRRRGNKLRLGILAAATSVGAAAILFVLFFQSGNSRLRRFSIECVGCHLEGALQLNGPMAAQFSQGVHTVHPRFDARGDAKQQQQVLTGKECAMCHEQAYATWQRSNHAKAFSNIIFRAGLERENHAWCINCHGPLWQPERVSLQKATQAQKPLNELHEVGVTCVVCHMRDGKIYTKGRKKHEDFNLFHRLNRDAKLGSSDFCAGCHQFNFPRETEPVVAYELRHPMQNTIAEFKEVTSEKIACHSCHIDGKDHSLHPRGQLQKNLKYSISHEKADRGSKITFDIRLENLGHNFPTGDLFRILSLYVFDDKGHEVFRKDYRKEVRVVDRAVVADSTLKPQKSTLVADDRTTFTTSLANLTCAIIYRRQGAIENTPEKLPMPDAEHRSIIYRGPCNTDMR